jgi:hypothetical protein
VNSSVYEYSILLSETDPSELYTQQADLGGVQEVRAFSTDESGRSSTGNTTIDPFLEFTKGIGLKLGSRGKEVLKFVQTLVIVNLEMFTNVVTTGKQQFFSPHHFMYSRTKCLWGKKIKVCEFDQTKRYGSQWVLDWVFGFTFSSLSFLT